MGEGAGEEVHCTVVQHKKAHEKRVCAGEDRGREGEGEVPEKVQDVLAAPCVQAARAAAPAPRAAASAAPAK